MANVGYASLSIIPVAKGFQNQLSSTVGPGAKAAGIGAGAAMGKGIAKGLEESKLAVQAASDKLAAARGKETDSANKTRVAELKLQELRDKGTAKSSQIEAAEGRLTKAKRDGERVTKTVTTAEKGLTEAQKDLDTATSKTADGMGKMSRTSKGAAKQLRGAGDAAATLPGPLGTVGTKLTSTADHFEQLGDSSKQAIFSAENVKMFAAVTATAAIGVTTALYQIGSSFGDMSNDIRIGTGATGDELKGLEDAAVSIGTSIPVSFGDAGSAIATLSTATGASGDSLEKLSEQVLNVSRLTKEDATINAERFGQVLNQWSIDADTGADSVDNLFKVTQDYGVGFSKLTDDLNQYGSVMQNAGFSMEDSAVLFGRLEQSGLKVSRVMPGLNSAFRGWADEGLNATDMLKEQVDAISGAEDSTKALSIATDSFGAEGAQRLTTAIRNGSFEVDGLAESLGDTSGIVAETDQATRTFAESWQILKNKGLEAVRGPAEKIFSIFTSATTTIANFASGIDGAADFLKILGIVIAPMVGIFLGVVGAVKAWTIAQAALNLVMKQNPFVKVAMVIAGLVAGVIYAYNNFESFRNVVQAAWEGIQTAAQFAWENILQPVFEAISSVITDVVAPAIEWLWTGVVQPAFEAIGQIVQLYWNNFVKPVFEAYKFVIMNVIVPAIEFLWKNVVEPAFKAIGEIVKFAWENVVKPAFEALKTGAEWVGDAIQFLWKKVVQPAWEAIGKIVKGAWDNVVKPVFEALRGGLDLVSDAFTSAVDWIGEMWSKITGIVAKPVKFVVETVYNDGIAAVWNEVAGWLSLPKLPLADLGLLGEYASGGTVPGYTPGRDTGLIAVGGGESVMRPEWTRAVGPQYVDQANSAARAGGTSGVRSFLGAYADGGIVDSITGIVNDRYPMMTITDTFRPGANDHHGANRAVDFSNGTSAGTPEMKDAAAYFGSTFGGELLELIHSPFNNNVKDGRSVGNGMGYYGPELMQQHQNHVHVASDHPLDAGQEEGSGGLVGWVKDTVTSGLRSTVAFAFDKIMDPIGNAIPTFGDSLPGRIPKEAFNTMKDGVRDFLLNTADEVAPNPAATGWSGGVEAWDGTIEQVLAAMGLPAGWKNLTKAQMGTESGGDPFAINLTDSNALKGTPSKGLMQVIDPTFDDMWQQFGPATGYPKDVWDPHSNIAAGLQWVMNAHGGPEGTWGQGHGYDDGGLAVGAGYLPKPTIKPERVLDPDTTVSFERLVQVIERPDFIEVLRSITDGIKEPGLNIKSESATASTPDAGDKAALKSVTLEVEPAESMTTPEATAVQDQAKSPQEQAEAFIGDNGAEIAETLMAMGLGITVNNHGSSGVSAWNRAADRRTRRVRMSNR